MAQLPGFLGDIRKGDRIQFAVESFDASWSPDFFDVIDNDTMLNVITGMATESASDSPLSIKWVNFELLDDFNTDGLRLQTYKEGRMYSIVVKGEPGSLPTDGDGFIVNFRVQPEDRRAFIGTVEKGKILYFMHREENRDSLFFDVWDSKNDAQILVNVPMTQTGQQGNNLWKGEIDSEATDDLVIGQTYWIRVKDIASDDPNLSALYSFSVLPRLEVDLKKLLALGGENLVMDNFAYDQSGNILA